MPWLYHKYAGHDINRDAFMMNLAENRNLARFFYTRVASAGVPDDAPDGEQRAALLRAAEHRSDRSQLRSAHLARGGAARRRHDARARSAIGTRGVVSNAMYDYYWPGYEDSAPLGHNTVCLLTEVASVEGRDAGHDRAGRSARRTARACPTTGRRSTFPIPGRAARWTLRDIVDYDLSAVRGLLSRRVAYREPIVQNFYDMGARAVEAGRAGRPVRVPHPARAARSATPRAKLEELLLAGRRRDPPRARAVPRRRRSVSGRHRHHPPGAAVSRVRQDAARAAELSGAREPRRRPARASVRRRRAGRCPRRWACDVRTIERTFEPPAMSRVTAATIAAARRVGRSRSRRTTSSTPAATAGAIAVNRLRRRRRCSRRGLTGDSTSAASGTRQARSSCRTSKSAEAGRRRASRASSGCASTACKGKLPANPRPIGAARASALYKPWIENIDEGWTRLAARAVRVPVHEPSPTPTSAPATCARSSTSSSCPSAPAERLVAGHPPDVVPPEYAGGLGAGGRRGAQGVRRGGRHARLPRSGRQASPSTRSTCPLRDVTREAASDRFFCPGLDPAPRARPVAAARRTA